MHNYVIVLICMTLLFYFLLNKLFARLRFSQNYLNLLVTKIDKKQFLSTEERAQIVPLKQFEVFFTSNCKEDES